MEFDSSTKITTNEFLKRMELLINGKYKVLPKKGISPYLNTKRFQKPKEIFKHSIDILNKLNFKKKLDICCANGEFLYLLKKFKIGILLG